MHPISWLRRIAGVCFAVRDTPTGRTARNRRNRYRPTVEILEDRLAPASITTLAAFDGANGAQPNGGLIADAGGNLFGTAQTGGAAYGYGSIFEIKAGSNEITTLASFDRTTTGVYPYGLLEDSQGDLFGTTSSVSVDGGPWGASATTFELKAGSGTITTLARYGVSNLVLDSKGNLFGWGYITGGAGADVAPGTIVELRAGSSTFTTVFSFNDSAWGPLLADSSGDIFGVELGAGTLGRGLVFELKAGSDTISPLASFGANAGRLGAIDAAGDLFGMMGGDYGSGTFFELKAGSGAITTLASFNSGGFWLNGLAMDAAGNLFAAGGGGAYGQGSIVEVKAGSNTITTIASFDGANGGGPNGPLTVDALGHIFGTTYRGGANNDGTVFEITPAETAFVDAAYQQILNRAPDPGGFGYWSQQLNNGVSPSSVIQDIEQSTEYLTNEVTALYHQFLNRAPEAGGLQHWIDQLAGGASIGQVRAGILASPEYFNAAWTLRCADSCSIEIPSPSLFLNNLYQDVLGRIGSTAEVQGWLDALAGGMSRLQVASAFLASQEYGTHLIDSYYSQFLGRSPEASGLASWLQQIQAGTSQETILAEIFGSDEGLAKWS